MSAHRHMSSRALQLIGGWITIAAAALFFVSWAIAMLLGNPIVGDIHLARWLALPAHIFMLLGLVSIYLVQADRGGAWGLAGFLLAFAGVAIFIGYVIGGWTAAIPEPRLGPIGGLLWLAGLLILAVFTWQAGVLPRWAGVFWFVGAVLYATGVPGGPDDLPRVTALVGALLIAVGFGWAGTGILTIE